MGLTLTTENIISVASSHGIQDDLPHRNLILPHVLGLLGNKVGDLRGHVAWGDGIGASISYPLNRQ